MKRDENGGMVYHYTSIETLCLIIKSKNIRFNRLDLVDDMEESAYCSGPTGINLNKYVFVSCWTKCPEENIALWDMYTKNIGVRIGLKEDMFISYKINDNLNSFFPDERIYNEELLFSRFLNSASVYDIIYTDEIEMKNQVNSGMQRIGNAAVIKHEKFGTYKRTNWSFQKECRYRLYSNPLSNLNFHKARSFHYETDSSIEGIMTNMDINTQFIDMPLNTNKLCDIEVLIGPHATEKKREMVYEILKEYPNATIKNSTLNIRKRNK